MTVAAATERAIGRCLTAGTAALAWADPRHLLITDAANSDDPLRLYLLDIESGATRSLSEPPAGSFGDDFPQISSSGRIAFARQFGVNRADVFTLDARGDKGQRLTQDSGIVSGLAWDRSGDGLFYASTRGGDAGLWWVAGNGGQPQRISAGLLDYRRVSQARAGFDGPQRPFSEHRPARTNPVRFAALGRGSALVRRSFRCASPPANARRWLAAQRSSLVSGRAMDCLCRDAGRNERSLSRQRRWQPAAPSHSGCKRGFGAAMGER